MPDYQQAKIYKLVCNITNKCYIGSTCQTLPQRLKGHVYDSNRTKLCSSKEIIDGGNYSIILLEEFPCNSNNELLKKEYHYMDIIECINKIRGGIITDEMIKKWDMAIERRKQKKRERYQKNKNKNI